VIVVIDNNISIRAMAQAQVATESSISGLHFPGSWMDDRQPLLAALSMIVAFATIEQQT